MDETVSTASNPIVDVSIDFDFFVRELPEWDFSHNDTHPDPMLYKEKLWLARYATHRLYLWTDIPTYADFLPETLFAELCGDKGLKLGDPRGRRIGVADSHRHAFEFFHAQWKLTEPPQLLLNIDAHHDCYPIWTREMVEGERLNQIHRKVLGAEMPDDPLFDVAPGLNCENWITHLFDHWRDHTRIVQLYPRWKPMQSEKPRERPIEAYHWKAWPGLDGARNPAHLLVPLARMGSPASRHALHGPAQPVRSDGRPDPFY